MVPNLNSLVDYNFDYKKWWGNSEKIFLKGLEGDFKFVSSGNKLFPHKHLLLMSGEFIDNEFLWEVIIPKVLESLNKIEPIRKFDNYLNTPPPPQRKIINFLKRVKKLGIKQVQFNLEVSEERLFKEICRGKGESLGYEKYLEALKKAVGVFGKGNVRTNFVLGIQPIETLVRRVAKLAQSGIVSDYSIFQPKRNTPFEKTPSPSLEEILYFTRKLAEIYKRHKFKPIYCSLSSRSSVINEYIMEEGKTIT